MLQQQFPNKILWLASYPKSGNTWFRAFLSALMNDGELEINDMKTNGIFSARAPFDAVTDLFSTDLYDEEAKLMLADVYRYIAAEKETLSIVKIHDAFTLAPDGRNLIPEDVTHCALYFIRNPLDIAGSLANHMHISIEKAVTMLNNSNAVMAQQRGNFNTSRQFPQHLYDWSSHVKSWTTRPSFPVYVIRYEDMLANSFETFNNAIKFVGLNYSIDEVQMAIAATTFNNMSKQETEKGFIERPGKSSKFFRKGTMGNWEHELNQEQIDIIKSAHKDVMNLYGY